MKRCIEDSCQRRRIPHYSRCRTHLDALIAALFGPVSA